MTTTKSTKSTKSPRKPSIKAWFQEWLTARDEVAVIEERVALLRQRLLDAVDEHGEVDEKGSAWLDLPSPVLFTDHDGRTARYTVLKRERHLRPAVPTPDPTKAAELLADLGLWLTPGQEEILSELEAGNPYISISVNVDVDAVAGAYFKGLISEEQYDAILVEQKESFQFRPAESA